MPAEVEPTLSGVDALLGCMKGLSEGMRGTELLPVWLPKVKLEPDSHSG